MMNQEYTTTIKSTVLSRLSGWQGALLQVGGLVAALIVASWIRFYLPFSPVPVTLQTFVILLAAVALPVPRAMWGIAIYVGLGVVGFPVTASPMGFLTFGYLLGFILAPWIVAQFRHILWGMSVAMGIVYRLGVLWLMMVANLTFVKAFSVGVLPFLPGDALKMFLVTGIIQGWKRFSSPWKK